MNKTQDHSYCIIITFTLFILLLALVWGIFIHEKKLNKLREQNEFLITEIHNYAESIERIRATHYLVPIIEQILTPLQTLELKLLAEQLKQRKQRSIER